MTRLFALVRTADDAETAVAAGVDGIVVRPAALPTLSAVASVVAGHCAVSLWWDNSASSRALGVDAADARTALRADEVWMSADIAPFGGPVWAAIASGDAISIATAAAQGCRGIVICGGPGPQRLLDKTSVAEIETQCRRVRLHDLPFAIAGTMEVPDIPRLLAFAPDRLVVDEVIRQDPKPGSPIAPDRVRLLRDLVTMAIRGRGPSSATVAAGPDRIFVRDWIVPLHLGAYDHERDAQRVRFTVEAEVSRSRGRATDMRDVVTYDLITDAIARATVAHVALVETIAEDVAALVLAHPRVEAVDITVEKLDLGPGSLGCRIMRRRA